MPTATRWCALSRKKSIAGCRPESISNLCDVAGVTGYSVGVDQKVDQRRDDGLLVNYFVRRQIRAQRQP